MNKAKLLHLAKHYVYALIVAGVAIYQTGNHDIKKVAYAALIAVGEPVVELAWLKIKAQSAKPVGTLVTSVPPVVAAVMPEVAAVVANQTAATTSATTA
jgi:hypothetical protein